MSANNAEMTDEESRKHQSSETAYFNRNKVLFITDAGLAQSMTNLCTGAFLTAYALYLGGDYFSIGILNAVLFFGLIIQIPSTLIVEKYPESRKLVAVSMLTISRISLILSGILPLILSQESRFGAFFILYLVFVLIGNIGGCAFGAWFRDAFSPLVLYQVITSRFTISVLSGAIVSFIAGIVIEIVKEKYVGFTGYAYSCTFVVSGLLGIGSSISLYLIHSTNVFPSQQKNRKVSIKIFLEPIRNNVFMKVLFFTALWNFLFNLINPFIPVFFLKRTVFSLLFVICLTVINQFSTVLSFSIWQRYSLTFGAKSLLYLCTPLLFLSVLGLIPLPSLHSRNLTTVLSITLNIFNGFFLGGIILCLTNLIFQKSPEGKSTAYLALSNSVSGFMAGISSLSTGYLARILNSYPVTIRIQEFTLDLTGIEIIFLISAVVGIFFTMSVSSLIPSNVLKDS